MPDSVSQSLVLAVDAGTTNTKVLLVRPATGAVVASSSRPVGITFPAPGWAEQDAEQLWQATAAAMAECLVRAPQGTTPAGVAITNQRESVVAWSRRTGAALGPVLGWQDVRTAESCRSLADREGAAEVVRDRTGLSLDPMFSAPKLRWLLDDAIARGADPDDVALGTIDAWLVFRLTGKHVIEAGNASRTLLLGLRELDWDEDLLDLFGLSRNALPQVRGSDGGFGRTFTGLPGIPAGLPVLAVLADSHAALYHHGCREPGTGKATYGTGSSVMTPCLGPEPAPPGIATTLAWHADGQPTYAREGNIMASGSALDWMARTLGAPPGLSGGEFLSGLAREVPDSGGATLVPAFSGLGAPYLDRRATGLLTGVTAGTGPAHLARAALEAVAHQVVDVVEAIESDGGARVTVLHADGGATASGLLMQLQADLLGRPVHVAPTPEASALGVAALAARAVGLPVAASSPSSAVTPAATDRSMRRDTWARAVARARWVPETPAG
jgi:glycerol kinase